ncbi:exosome complex component CSL4 [Raphidocelis subcapitata]|uniref:Exosome complex component CSL4 n=1 Tax=Raphidocelis subcapitata TaxID=307507 RepID=A0A2V0NRY0_9CHLO|nr:exosome complex component CSL4 [Raphidocelis subcapitata]|eukprot:GBF88330.1 exosome complex component CSL4 [Raphidocelis subcapitata]
MAAGELVCVGDRLGNTEQHAPGPGTYARNGFIHASVVGALLEAPPPPDGGPAALSVAARAAQPVVPEPGAVVTAKVSQVTPTGAHCRILCVGPRALDVEFKGLIRLPDVRATDVDRVVMSDCFRPGDVVRAEVVSLGDARSYHLTTARNELGVVHATSMAGNVMVPVSWASMRDPETQREERRKVARVAAAPGAAA